MIELDAECLRAVNQALRKRIEAHERRASMAPLRDALLKQIQLVRTQVVPEIMAKPNARVEQSTLALEAALAEFPKKLKEADEIMSGLLESSKSRTAALEVWLESLS